MKTIKGFEQARKLLERSLPYGVSAEDSKIEASVKEIIEKVQKEGDKALLAYTLRFDGAKLK
jgi:histidinol dehydrogenase